MAETSMREGAREVAHKMRPSEVNPRLEEAVQNQPLLPHLLKLRPIAIAVAAGLVVALILFLLVSPRMGGLGLILVFSVGCAAAWYILVMLTVGSALPADELGASGLAAAEGMAALWNSSVMGDVLVLGGIAGILTSWNGFVIGVSRLLYAMAQSGFDTFDVHMSDLQAGRARLDQFTGFVACGGFAAFSVFAGFSATSATSPPPETNASKAPLVKMTSSESSTS